VAIKVAELVQSHGPVVTRLIESGRIPQGQISNFFGRALPRQKAIVAAMKSGSSYSKAYNASGGDFDTRTWHKVPARLAAARGYLLSMTARLARRGDELTYSTQETRELGRLAKQLDDETLTLIRHLLRCECREQEVGHSRKRQDNSKVELSSVPFAIVRRELRTAIAKLGKTSRDIPLMTELLGEQPTVRQVVRSLVEIGRIRSSVPLFILTLNASSPISGFKADNQLADDPWGIGYEYASSLQRLRTYSQPARHIATHSAPDADAITAAWLAERFVFPGERCQIHFVNRRCDLASSQRFDCIVDLGQVYDANRLRFDHKPPAFRDRNLTCAAKLVWKYVNERECSVAHLSNLVDLVHDGDASTRRSRSKPYTQSRRTGLHALIRHGQEYCQGDAMLYQAIKGFLNEW